jgi:hypothetical protein
MIEGGLAYDYGINFREAYRNLTNGDITEIERTSIGVTHGQRQNKIRFNHFMKGWNPCPRMAITVSVILLL